jgi:hypothetical protein
MTVDYRISKEKTQREREREREKEKLYHQDRVAIVAVDIANMLGC